MVQGPDQPVQSFLADLKPISRNCNFKIECTAASCKQSVDFTDRMVLQQMIYGLADDEIQRKILGKTEMTLEEAEKFVIAEESGKWSQLESKSEQQMAAGISSYKFQQIQQQQVQKKKQCCTCGKDELCPASEF